MTLSIIALLACGSDQNLQQEQQGNVGVSGCECVDNTAQVTELAAEVERLTREIERMDTDLAEIAEDTPTASSLVVTEYDIDCIVGRDSDGELIWADPYVVTDSGETLDYSMGCKVGEVDPSDLPFLFTLTTIEDRSLTESDFFLRYEPYQYGALDVAMHTSISASGDVVAGAVTSYSIWQNYATEESFGVPVHVVIVDDKAYPTPDAW